MAGPGCHASPVTRDTAPSAARQASAYAHRGVHVAAATRRPDEAPGENTAGAVRAAAALGYRWVETDVRATADGAVVLAHDADLARVLDAGAHPVVLSEHTLEELTAVAHRAGYELTTLEQACDADPDVQLNIDVKDPAAVPGVLALAARRPELVARWRVTSFSERTRSTVVRGLRSLPAVAPVRTSASAPLAAACYVITRAPLPRAARAGGVRAVRHLTGLDALQLPPTATLTLPPPLVRALGPVGARLQAALTDLPVVDHALLDAAHRAGVEVHVWTVDDRAAMTALLDAGVDAVITDQPGVLADVLRERGQPWPEPGARR